MSDEWGPLSLVIKGYSTLAELEQLSWDDVDVMLVADHAWTDAEPEED